MIPKISKNFSQGCGVERYGEGRDVPVDDVPVRGIIVRRISESVS
jgi:hypothetical protein